MEATPVDLQVGEPIKRGDTDEGEAHWSDLQWVAGGDTESMKSGAALRNAQRPLMLNSRWKGGGNGYR